MLWDEREDSRAFHSKRLLCEVLDERSTQIRHAAETAARRKEEEMQLLASLREQWQVVRRFIMQTSIISMLAFNSS